MIIYKILILTSKIRKWLNFPAAFDIFIVIIMIQRTTQNIVNHGYYG